MFKKIVFASLSFVISIPVSANSITSLYNTGVDSSRTTLSNGTIGDPHYTLTSVPSGTSTIVIRTSAGGYPIGPWLGDDSLSTWIKPNNPGNTDPLGLYDYQTTFNLAGLLPSSASITGIWSTDNFGLDILINGSSTGQTQSSLLNWTSFNINSGFIAGINTLDFIVQNVVGTGLDPTGLRVEMTETASPSSPVPEPATFALIGIGLATLAFGKRRKLDKTIRSV